MSGPGSIRTSWARITSPSRTYAPPSSKETRIDAARLSMRGSPRIARPARTRGTSNASPLENARPLEREPPGLQAARDDVEPAALLAGAIGRAHVEPHIADDAREEQTPRARRLHGPVDLDGTRRGRKHASGERRSHERSREDPRCDARRRGEALRAAPVVLVEEAGDEPRAEDEPHAVAACGVPHAKGCVRLDAPVVPAGRRDDALGPRRRAATHAEVSRDRAHRPAGGQGDGRHRSPVRPRQRRDPSHV
jgi:hypothetical protein